MNSPLSVNVVRAVTREILTAKSGKLDMLLEAVVRAALPKVTEEAELYLECCWPINEQEKRLEEAAETMVDLLQFFDLLEQAAEVENIHDLAIGSLDFHKAAMVAWLQHYRERRARLTGVAGDPAQIAAIIPDGTNA